MPWIGLLFDVSRWRSDNAPVPVNQELREAEIEGRGM